jgi:hypothetical protein
MSDQVGALGALLSYTYYMLEQWREGAFVIASIYRTTYEDKHHFTQRITLDVHSLSVSSVLTDLNAQYYVYLRGRSSCCKSSKWHKPPSTMSVIESPEEEFV